MTDGITKMYAEELVKFSDGADEQQILNDTRKLADYLESEITIRNYLKSPVISNEKKLELMKSFTENSVLLRFVAILAKRSRLDHTIEILKFAEKLMNLQNNVVEVVVTSVIKLSDAQIVKVRELVRKFFKHESEIVNRISKCIIGGLTIQVGDYLLDLSIRKQFEMMGKSIA